MKIEQEKHWCCCHQSSLQQEQLQEQTSRGHLSKNQLFSSQINPNQSHANYFSPTKLIFSFRDLQCRPLSPQKEKSTFNRFKSLQQPSNVLTLSKSLSKGQLGEIRSTLFHRIEVNSKPKLHLPMSPPLKEAKDPQITFTLTDRSHTPAGRANSPKVKFIMSNPNPPAKMAGKRIKTIEEQTEYSSKHSQIHFKNGNECTQAPCFSFKNSFSKPQKQVFFKDDFVSENSHSSLNFPSCREVSAHQEVDNSVSNQLFQNARTMQTIVTSTQFKSRQPSVAFFNFIKSRQISKVTLKNSGDTAEFPSLDKIEHKSQLESIYQSPKSRFYDQTPDNSVLNSQGNIERKAISPEVQSNMFYSEETFKKKVRSPKISVLNITEKQNSEEEELRDRIDHKYLESLHCSKVHSPFISINQSLKVVTDDRRPAMLRSSDHSREVSWELPLLKETFQQLKRTNTIESLNSSVSEHSLLDMKFIQKNRSRRGVSKLV